MKRRKRRDSDWKPKPKPKRSVWKLKKLSVSLEKLLNRPKKKD